MKNKFMFLLGLCLLASNCGLGEDHFSDYRRGDLYRFPLGNDFEVISPTEDKWFLLLPGFDPNNLGRKVYQLSDIEKVGVLNDTVWVYLSKFPYPRGIDTPYLKVYRDESNSVYVKGQVGVESENFVLSARLNMYDLDTLINIFRNSPTLPAEWYGEGG